MIWEQKSYTDWKLELDEFISKQKVLTAKQVSIIIEINKQLIRLDELSDTTSSRYRYHCNGMLNSAFGRLYDTLK